MTTLKSPFEHTWIKMAAMQAPNDSGNLATDDPVEAAFAEQAYDVVSKRAGVLMKDPYRLGFEVVWKNEQSSKCAGVFGFRVGSKLYLCPVFFLKGSIMLGDQLWDVDEKRFMLLSEETARDLVSQERGPKTGTSVARSTTTSRPLPTYIHRIAEPFSGGGQVKYARAGRFDGALEAWHDMVRSGSSDALRSLADGDAMLEEFFKSAGARPFEALTELVGSHAAVASAVHSRGADWLERMACAARSGQEALESRVKSAASEREPEPAMEPAYGKLRAFDEKAARLLPEAMHKEVLEKLAGSSGAPVFVDARDESTLSVTYHSPVLELERPNCACKCSYIGSDMQMHDALHFPCVDLWLKDFHEPGSSPTVGSCGIAPSRRLEHAGLLVSTKGVYCGNPGSGFQVAITGDLPKSAVAMPGTLSVGDYFLLLPDAKSAGTDIYKVLKKIQKEGVLILLVMRRYTHYVHELVFNDRAQSGRGDANVFGPSARVHKLDAGVVQESRRDGPPTPGDYDAQRARVLGVDPDLLRDYGVKPIPSPAPESSVTNYLLAHGLPGAPKSGMPDDESEVAPVKALEIEVVKNGAWKKASILWRSRGRSGSFAVKSPEDAVGVLAGRLRLHVDAAQDLVKAADSEDRARVLARPPVTRGGLVKCGAAWMRMPQLPAWHQEIDPDLNARIHPNEELFIATPSSFVPRPPQARIGDGHVVNPGGERNRDGNDERTITREEIMSLSPEELGAVATERGTANVFPHGILGSLLHANGSIDMLDQWVPKLAEGVDAIGRIRFLMHWQPREFEEAFGQEDHAQMEADLKAEMQSLGRLHLNLSRRLPKRTERTADFSRGNED